MFALIETNGATHIAIHIPKDGADKSLPALAAMLEGNATFINNGWRNTEIVRPKMSITLGDTHTFDSDETGELTIAASSEVIGEDFVIAVPEVLISNRKAIEKKSAEIDRLRQELQNVRYQLDAANSRLTELTTDESDGD